MKKNKENRVLKYIFWVFFLSFLVIYFSGLTGYYEYQNYKKATFTKEQIKQFELDIAKGKKVDMNEYINVDTADYSNNLSKFTGKLSILISDIVSGGVEGTFKYLSKLIDE